jgi:hypothetical protein
LPGVTAGTIFQTAFTIMTTPTNWFKVAICQMAEKYKAHGYGLLLEHKSNCAN